MWTGGIFAGKKVYVSPAGDDSAPGSVAQPVATVARGMALAQGGCRVYLREGVYVESVDVQGLSGSWLTPKPRRRVAPRRMSGTRRSLPTSPTAVGIRPP
jgi:hypothetical protein